VALRWLDALLCVAFLAIAAPAPTAPPVAPSKPVTDDYFGTKIVDPYRWMEDIHNPALLSWMKAQNDYTRSILDSIPGRSMLLAQLNAANEGTAVNGLQVAGKRLFFTLSTNGGAGKLFYRQGEANRLILDPQQGMPTGAHAAIQFFSPSTDGKYVAVGVAVNGAEQDTTISVLETTSGRDLGERIAHAWDAKPYWVRNAGFFYSRWPVPGPGAQPTEAEERQQVFFHALGRSPGGEKPRFGFGVLGDIEPSEESYVYSAPGSRFAIGVVENGADNVARFYAAPLAAAMDGTTAWHPLGKAFLDPGAGGVDEPGLVDVALHGDTLYAIRFDLNRRTEVIAANLRSGETLTNAKVIIAASDQVHRSVTTASDGLYVWSSSGGISRLERVSYRTNVAQNIALPYNGTLTEPAADTVAPGVAFGITAWTRPLRYFMYDPRSGRVAETGLESTTKLDVSSYSADEVTVVSKDGTDVPLSILHANDVALDGSHPAIVYGYGSYGISVDSEFLPWAIPWLKHGGILAAAHVRGGGELGEPWHLAGKGSQKQHTIDDFIACAQYLIAKGYTSRARLASWGTSAGGITIGNAIVQRPDLFAVAFDNVGVTDMLRYETTANGLPNVPEFGSVKTERGFKALYAVSAYNHIVDGTRYPAVLLTTGANDPRVDSWVVAKMAARLQAASTSGKPVLLRVNYAGGHAAGSSALQADELLADWFSFALWQTGDPEFQPQSTSAPNAGH
jgi:prolyl oligopeptidase